MCAYVYVLVPDRACCQLVDSNVFLRSLLITVQREELVVGSSYDASTSRVRVGGFRGSWRVACNGRCCVCQVTQFLASNTIPILYRLMTCVVVEVRVPHTCIPACAVAIRTHLTGLAWLPLQKVSQENICCINSSLALLLYAHKRGRLPTVLQVLWLYCRERRAVHLACAHMSRLVWLCGCAAVVATCGVQTLRDVDANPLHSGAVVNTLAFGRDSAPPSAPDASAADVAPTAGSLPVLRSDGTCALAPVDAPENGCLGNFQKLLRLWRVCMCGVCLPCKRYGP